MRYLLIFLVIVASCARGVQTIQGPPGTNGVDGANGSNGQDGSNGLNGAKGDQGYGAGLVVTSLSPGATCPAGGVQLEGYQDANNNGSKELGEQLTSLSFVCNGTAGGNGNNGADGHDGSNGSNGTNGTNGVNGTNTTFSVVADLGANCTNGGFDVTFTDSIHSSTEYICNGTNGTNGNNGQAGTNGTNGSNGGTVSFSLVQAIEPCGAASSPWKEVLLGLMGGQLLASFSENAGGQNTRFAFIPNGSYVDTDSSGCTFTVSGNGSTTSQISWNAGSNGYSNWVAGGYSWTSVGGWVAL